MTMLKKASHGSVAPLMGKKVMVTRPRSQAEGLAQKIEELGGTVIQCATIQIEPPDSYAELDSAIQTLGIYDWLIFTSVNGVEHFLVRAERLNRSMADIQRVRIAAIGPGTARRLRSAGIDGCLVPHQYQAEGLLAALKPESVRGKKILIPRAAKARDILPQTLAGWGAEVNVVEAYQTVAPPVDVAALRALFRHKSVDAVTFTSSSTVANFARLFSGEKIAEVLNGVAVACIGPITQATLEELGGRADIVAPEFTIDGLVQALVDFFARPAGSGVTT
jgi:uroporphyrinogen III methyltransferase/synthase